MWNWVYICRHNSYELKGNSESCLRCCATHKTAGESAFVYTHTHADIISFSVGYCCHRQCFLLLHLYSLETRNGWKMITGESAVCVILSFHCSFPLFSCFSHITFSQLSPSSCLFPEQISHCLTFTSFKFTRTKTTNDDNAFLAHSVSLVLLFLLRFDSSVMSVYSLF